MVSNREPGKFRNTLTWDSLKRLNKIVVHLTNAANEIDELAPNILDYGKISQTLQERQGVNLKKLKDCCDEMIKINNEGLKLAQEFEKYLDK